MRRLRSLLLGFLLAALLVPVASDGASKGCRNVYGGDAISATNMGCQKARSIVRLWGIRAERDGRANRRVRAFSCRGKSNPIEGLVVTCASGKRKIRFYANVPPR